MAIQAWYQKSDGPDTQSQTGRVVNPRPYSFPFTIGLESGAVLATGIGRAT